MPILNFNAAQVEPAGSFEPIPNDWYNVTINDSDIKATKDGEGSFLALTLKVMDGEYANRLVFCRLNIVNKNPTAVEIAFALLSSICHAINVIDVGDTSELHGKPFQVKVVVRPPKGEYEASNECKAFRACDGGAPSAGSSTGQKKATPAWADKSKAAEEEEVEEDDDEEAALEAQLAAAKEKKAAAAKKKKVAAEKKAKLKAELAAAEAEEEEEAEEEAEVDPAEAQVEEVEVEDDGEEKPPWMQ